MNRAQRVILQEIRGGYRGKSFPRSYFESFPIKRKRAMDLMWDGLIEHDYPDGLRLTPAGHAALNAEMK